MCYQLVNWPFLLFLPKGSLSSIVRIQLVSNSILDCAREQGSDFDWKGEKLPSSGRSGFDLISSRLNALLQNDWAIQDQVKTRTF